VYTAGEQKAKYALFETIRETAVSKTNEGAALSTQKLAASI
jgi:hypothetical protein